MWNLPRPGIKPVSPASAGGFLTSLPPGKSDMRLVKRAARGSLGKLERKSRSAGFYHKPLGAICFYACVWILITKTIKSKTTRKLAKKTYGEMPPFIRHWGHSTLSHNGIPAGVANQKWGNDKFQQLLMGCLLGTAVMVWLPRKADSTHNHPMTLESSPRHTSWGTLVREFWEMWTRPSQHTARDSPKHPPQRHALTNGAHSSNRAWLSDKSNKLQLLRAARLNVINKMSLEKSKLRRHRRVLLSKPPEKPYGLSSF